MLYVCLGVYVCVFGFVFVFFDIDNIQNYEEENHMQIFDLV